MLLVTRINKTYNTTNYVITNYNINCETINYLILILPFNKCKSIFLFLNTV